MAEGIESFERLRKKILWKQVVRTQANQPT